MKKLDFHLTKTCLQNKFEDFVSAFFGVEVSSFENQKENILTHILITFDDSNPESTNSNIETLVKSCGVYSKNNFDLNTTEEEFAFACAKHFGCEVVFFQPEGKIEGFEAIRYFADGHKDYVNLIQGDEHDYLSTQPILPYRD